MKVFFDGNIFTKQKIGGISRLNFELIKGLTKKEDVEAIFYHGFYIDDYLFQKKWFAKAYGLKKRFFIKQRFMNFLDNLWMNVVYQWHATPDTIFHSLYYRIPQKPKGPVVVHVYDMIQELFGGNKKTVAFKKKSFDAADVIIAISDSTKQDICKLYAINPDKIIIVYPGVSGLFFKDARPKTTQHRPYMLYVGARNYKYKNFEILLNTFINKKYFLQFDLVVFGGEKLYEKQPWLRQEFGDDEMLAQIYVNAFLFIYPSLYEGFGIPPLEAMAAGCPVIASNTSSIPEVVGEAGLLFNPENPDDLVGKIEKIIHEKILTNNLIKKGKIRARQFTWDSMVDTIYRAYRKLLKTKNL